MQLIYLCNIYNYIFTNEIFTYVIYAITCLFNKVK